MKLATLALLAAPVAAQDSRSVGSPATGIPVSSLTAAASGSQALYICTSQGSLYRIEEYKTSPTAVLLGNPGIGGIGDIAIDQGTGRFLANQFGGSLFWVDPITMVPTTIGVPNFGDLNALEASHDGLFYGRGFGHTDLWLVDTTTAQLTSIGSTGSASAGDLAMWVEDTLLGTTSLEEVDEIDRSNGSAVIVGPSGIFAPYGLEVDDDGTIYVFSSDGSMYTWNYSTQQATLVATLSVSGSIWGAAFGPPVSGGGPLGKNYCSPANLNSSGFPALIGANGSPFVFVNDVELVASGMPAGEVGIFLNSQTQDIFFPPGSQGFLCVGGAIGRYSGDVLNTGGQGRFALQLDLFDTPTPGGPVAIQPGETWFFQAWFRDHNPDPTSNFTDGVAISFQ